eukprot:575632-Lingulodinium_polyedra.AAC.1
MAFSADSTELIIIVLRMLAPLLFELLHLLHKFGQLRPLLFVKGLAHRGRSPPNNMSIFLPSA